jgi:hypothetical protein
VSEDDPFEWSYSFSIGHPGMIYALEHLTSQFASRPWVERF